MKARIQEIISKEHISNADFAERIKVSPATISAILNDRNKPSLDVVTKIHAAFPKISLAWLIDGEGEMYNHKQTVSAVPELFDENLVNDSNPPSRPEYRKEIASETPVNTPKEIVKQEIRYIEKPQRKITEIRIFFDDNTFELFRPEK